ncbi:MAG: hypothetical protein H7308_14985, partial [Chthonomonadaceae bacterium]|nr:hypothetical protein [Chthonomonadaceae bacterium]
ELVAVADVREDNARLFLNKYNVDAPIFTNYEEMLAEIKPEILSIATWSHLHAERNRPSRGMDARQYRPKYP